jgi:hypothetical protein
MLSRSFSEPRLLTKISVVALASTVAMLLPGAAGATIRFDAPLLTQLAGRGSLRFPQHLAVGDLNGDGHPDVVTNADGGGTAVLLGNGDGSLAPPLVASQTGFEWYSVADFDGDGYADIVCGGTNGISVLFGNGSGVQYSAVQLSSDPQFGLVSGDFDGDGRQDFSVLTYLPVGSSEWMLQTFLQRPGRSFQIMTQRSDSLMSGLTDMRAADFNLDGRSDIALCQFSANSELMIGLSNGDGSFQLRAIEYPRLTETGGIDVCDLDGDGHPDLLAAQADRLFVIAGLGDGTFGELREVTPAPGHAFSVLACDMTGDGKPDILVPELALGEIHVYAGRGDFSFAPPISTSVGRALSPIVVADMDGDERPDLVATSVDLSHGVFVALGDGTGSFEPHRPRTTLFGEFTHVTIGDFNNDGLADVVLPSDDNVSSPNVSILLGQAHHAPVRMPSSPHSGSIDGAFAADLNEDGHLDVVTWGGSPSITWYQGLGDGDLAAPVAIPAPGALNLFDVADLTGDGHADLVVQDSGGFAVYPGRGDGTFDPPIEIPLGATAYDVKVANLNGDGLPDYVIASGSGVRTALGLGATTFANSFNLTSEYSASLVFGVGDLNLDGANEVLTPVQLREPPYGRVLITVSYTPGGTDPVVTQTSWPTAAVLTPPAPIWLRDLNGDNYPDVEYTLDGGFGIALNDGRGTPSLESGYDGFEEALYDDPSALSSGYLTTPEFLLGDLDGDGHLDAVLNSQWAGPGYGLTILWGRDPVPPTVALLGPAPSTALAVGQPATITWNATDNITVASIDLFVSRHGRDGPYQKIALGLANTGSYSWTAPPPLSDSVAFKVVARDSAGNVAWDRSGGLLSIGGDVGVASGTAAPPRKLAIRSVAPNPSHGALAIGFDLPRSGHASIALHDLQGRRVATLLEGSQTAGHTEFRASLDRISPRVPAGLYFLVLRSGSDRAVARVALTP